MRGHYNNMSKHEWDELFPLYDDLKIQYHSHAFTKLLELHPRFKAVKRSTFYKVYDKWALESRPDERTVK